MVEDADLVVSFMPKDELPEYVQGHHNVRYWDVADPRRQSIEFHRQIRDRIMKNTEDLVEKLDG